MRRRVLAAGVSAIALLALAAPAAATTPSPAPTAGKSQPDRIIGAESLSVDEQARQRVQEPLLTLNNRLHDLAGKAYEAQFAGSLVETRTNTLTVYWAGPVPAELARLGGSALLIKPARFSRQQLMAAAQQVMPDTALTGTAAAAGEVELAVDGSGITVSTGDLASAARGARPATAPETALLNRVAATRARTGIPINIGSATPGTPGVDDTRHADNSPYWAGAEIDLLGGSCTSGFSMYATGAPSTRFTLTAAHCPGYSDGVSVTNGAGSPMGTSDFVHILNGSGTPYDLGVVRLSSGKSNAPYIYIYEDSASGGIPVTGYATAGIPSGGNYCVHGMTGVNCNLLSGGQLWHCEPGHCFWTIAMNALNSNSMTWCRGDSGGPIYYWTGGTVVASGVVSWSNHELGDCSLTGGASVVATAVGMVPGLAVVTTSAP
ncbi:hypothetical protein Lfu02_00030 [Longispora fulva]|uniref:Peptidase S1 domain-containing protein n=1 Tax=Longispora fulva TaxID=619741 RepID=A0A8J7GQC4_9ACTN|nr:trypsin-like serine protease [Longispora fulva]MBG6136123.1 hypothetical protein [Longispora fulva]GIG55631.1 hypothetical protein Lfu02_00030 [Longispora fulva]